MAEMTPQQRELARHALGLPSGTGMTYRNHFCAGPGHDDFADWVAMVDNGFARRRGGSALSGGDDVFWVTLEGAKAALNPGEKLDPDDFKEGSDNG